MRLKISRLHWIWLILWLFNETCQSNQITIHADSDFYPCLWISALKSIDCLYSKLDSIPMIDAGNKVIEEFLIGGPDLTSVGSKVISGISSTLKRLTISNANIVTVDPLAFSNLTKLEQLTFRNKLKTNNIDLGQFLNGLDSLKFLNIHYLTIPSLSVNSFPSGSKLTTMYLSNTETNSIATDAFRNIGNSLKTISFQTLPNNAFTKMTEWLSPLSNLESLTLKTCGITQIPVFPSSLFNLLELDLSANSLISISSNAFVNIKSSLKVLTLTNNNLDDNSLSQLDVLQVIEKLDLEYNRLITKIPKIVRTSPRLSVLNLCSCGLQMIATNDFTYPALTILSLCSNPELRIVDSKAFEPLTNLTSLDLSRLPLRNMKIDGISGSWKRVFTQLAQLNKIILNNCILTDIFWDEIKAFPGRNVETLQLNSNNFTTIPNYIFMNFVNLVDLYLISNEISTVNVASFYGLPKTITNLDLSKNLISTLPTCIFDTFNSLSAIKLANNNLICDCQILWLKESHLSNTIPDFTCAAPLKNKNKNFKSLNTSDLLCQEGVTRPPLCTTLPPITSTSTKKSEVNDFLIATHIVYNVTTREFIITINISDINRNQFDDFVLTYKINNGVEMRIPLGKNKAEPQRISNVNANDLIEFCIISILNGREQRYIFNCHTERAPAGVTLAVVEIAVGVAITIIVLCIVIGIVLYCKCRSKYPLKKLMQQANRQQTSVQEAYEGYDYPHASNLTIGSQRQSRVFVRAGSRDPMNSSTDVNTRRTTLCTDFDPMSTSQMSFTSIGPGGNTIRSPVPLLSNHRNVQSTFNLSHYNNPAFSSSSLRGFPQALSMDRLHTGRQSTGPTGPSRSRLPIVGADSPAPTKRHQHPPLPSIPNSQESEDHVYEPVKYSNDEYTYMDDDSATTPYMKMATNNNYTPYPPLPPPRPVTISSPQYSQPINPNQSNQSVQSLQITGGGPFDFQRDQFAAAYPSNDLRNNWGEKIERLFPEDCQTNSLFSEVYDERVFPDQTDVSNSTKPDVREIGYF